ncbi:MAG: hypothetical protein HW390_3016 [Candidatus Brocadiaceae bacterium]|nr:hypothetical protein [Candidatus Brocadiaceae bacterium]
MNTNFQLELYGWFTKHYLKQLRRNQIFSLFLHRYGWIPGGYHSKCNQAGFVHFFIS